MNFIRNVIILIMMICAAQSIQAGEMEQKVFQAVSKTETAKKIIKAPEKWIKKKLKSAGIPESYVTTTIILAKPAIDGKISTKELKTGWRTSQNSVLRPDFEYNFREGSTFGYVNWKLEF